MVFFTMGTRQSIGLFLKPVTVDLDTDRESFALALAAHNLILGLPLASNDCQDRRRGPCGHPRKEDGARAWRYNDSTRYRWIEIAPPALHER